MASIPPNNYTKASEETTHQQQFAASFDYYGVKVLHTVRCLKRGLFDDAASTIRELQRELPFSNLVAKIAWDTEAIRMRIQNRQAYHLLNQENQPTPAAITAIPLDTQNPPSIEEIMNSEPLFYTYWEELIKVPDFLTLKDTDGNTVLHKALDLFGVNDCRTIFEAAMPVLKKHPELLDAKNLAGETLMDSATNKRNNSPSSRKALVALLELTYKRLKREPNVVEKLPDLEKTEEAKGAPTPISNSDVSPKTLLDPELEHESFDQSLEAVVLLPATAPNFL